MKKESVLTKLGLVCSLLSAAGSFALAVAELFDEEVPVPRRVVRVFLWLASCGVWTASLVLGLADCKAESLETDELTQIKEDDFYD